MILNAKSLTYNGSHQKIIENVKSVLQDLGKKHIVVGFDVK